MSEEIRVRNSVIAHAKWVARGATPSSPCFRLEWDEVTHPNMSHYTVTIGKSRPIYEMMNGRFPEELWDKYYASIWSSGGVTVAEKMFPTLPEAAAYAIGRLVAEIERRAEIPAIEAHLNQQLIDMGSLPPVKTE